MIDLYWSSFSYCWGWYYNTNDDIFKNFYYTLETYVGVYKWPELNGNMSQLRIQVSYLC